MRGAHFLPTMVVIPHKPSMPCSFPWNKLVIPWKATLILQSFDRKGIKIKFQFYGFKGLFQNSYLRGKLPYCKPSNTTFECLNFLRVVLHRQNKMNAKNITLAPRVAILPYGFHMGNW